MTNVGIRLWLLRGLLDDLNDGRNVHVFVRRRYSIVEYALATPGSKFRYPDGGDWHWVKNRALLRRVLREAIRRYERTQKIDAQAAADAKHWKAVRAKMRIEPQNEEARSFIGFSPNEPFVFIGGSAELPIQNDKSANLPGE